MSCLNELEEGGRRADVVCVDCELVWTTYRGLERNKAAARGIVNACRECEGPYRNPIPWAELFKNERTRGDQK